ncbi:MAG TPA: translocation/assembly module TamB domain-containing protein, partial [Vicinamibacteria bacterium]
MNRRSTIYSVLALAVAGGLLLLVGWFPQEYLRRPLERRLRAALGPGSRIARLHVVPGRLVVDVWGLVIDHPSYRLEVPHARLRLHPGLLLMRPLAFKEVALERPHLVLHPEVGPGTPGPPLRDPIFASQVAASGGTVEYLLPGDGGERILFRNVVVGGSIGQGWLDVAAAGGTWTRAPHAYALGEVSGRLRLSTRLDIRIERLELGTTDSRVRVTGSVGRLGDIRPDLRVEGSLDLRDVARFDPAVPPLSGSLDIEARAAKEGEEWGLTATARGGGLTVAGWPIEELEARIGRGEPPRADVQVDARLLGGRAAGAARLDGKTVRDGRLELSGIDLDRLSRQGVDLGLPLRGRVGGELTVAGPLGGALAVRGQLRADGHSGETAIQARATVAGRYDTAARAVNADFTLVLDADGRMGPAAVSVETAHLTARGQARGPLPPAIAASFDGTLDLRTASGPETVPVRGTARVHRGSTVFDLSARGFGGSLQAGGDLRGAVVRRLRVVGTSLSMASLRPDLAGTGDLRLEASGPVARLSGTADLDLRDVVWRNVVVGPATASVHATGGRGTLAFAAPELNASGAGTIDRRAFVGTLSLTQTPLAPLQPLLTPDRPLAGEVTGSVDVELPWSAPEGSVVTAVVEALSVETRAFSARARRPFTLVSRGGRYSLADLDIEGPGLVFQGAGELGRDAGDPIDLRGRLALDLSRLRVPDGWTLAGTISGDVELAGSLAQPLADGRIELSGVVFQRPGLPLITVEDGEVELEGDVATTTGLRASWAGGELILEGLVPLAAVLTPEQAQRLGIEPAPFDVEASFDLDLAYLPVRPGWSLTGLLEGDLVFSGTRQDPRAVGLLLLAGIGVEAPGGHLLTINEGTVDLSDYVASTDGITASLAGGTVELRGTAPLAALLADTWSSRFQMTPGEADLRLAWRDVQAGRLLDVLKPRRASGVVALVSGNATVRGRFRSVDTLAGTLHVDPVRAAVQGAEIDVSAFDATLEDGQVTTPGLTVSSSAASLYADADLDLRAKAVAGRGSGQIELRALSPFLEEGVVTGVAEVDITVEGPLSAPRPAGRIAVADGTLRLREIRQPMTAIAGNIVVDEGRFRVEGLSGMLGGGVVKVGGEGGLDGLRLADVRLEIQGEDLGLRYPVGGAEGGGVWQELKARVDADLVLTGSWGDFQLAGTLDAERSLYDADIFLAQGLLAPEVPPPAAETRSPFMDSVALNILVATPNPFVVRNNLAELEAEGALWLRGSLGDPTPFGHFEIRPGGKVFLQEREFVVETGSIGYEGDRTNPELSIRATTQIDESEGPIEVTVAVDGGLETPRLVLTSEPPLSEQELATLVATGRSSLALDGGAWVVGEQAAALLAGRLTRAVSRELMGLGLDQVDIQPEVLAREGEPSARFTIGKQITRQLRLLYSVSISEPEAQYYQALLRFRRGMEASVKVQRRLEGNYAYSVGQRLRFGGAPLPRDTDLEATELAEVRLEEGLREFPQLRARLRAKPGKKMTYFDLLEDADRLREELVGQGYLEAVVDVRLDGQVAVFGGSSGIRYRWRVEGMGEPPDLAGDFRESLFEEEAADRGRERLLDELRRRGHLRASVEVERVREDGFRTLVFRVDPGPVLRPEITFPGATELSASALEKAAGGPAAFLTAPRDAEEGIRAAYRQSHYLAAKAGPVQVTEGADGSVRIVVPIEEGPHAVVKSVRLEGATRPEAEILAQAALPTGEPYDEFEVTAGVQRVRAHYLGLGYPAVRVVPRVEPAGTDLEVVIAIAEGQAQTIGAVTIVGLRRTRESLVRGRIPLQPGAPLDPRRLAETERRLRSLGIFRRVVVIASSDPVAAITVDVTEDSRYIASWDASFNDEEGWSGLVDGEVDNLFGRGMSLGGRFRAGQRVLEERVSFHVPVLGPGNFTAAAWRLDETVRVVTEVPLGIAPGPPFDGRKLEYGMRVQQALHDFRPWSFIYGAGIKRTSCPEQGLPPLNRDRRGRLSDPCENSDRNVLAPDGTLLRPTLDIGAVDVSAIRDTRDNPLNPIRGGFLSVNVQYAPRFLGSDFDFVRTFGQVSFIHDLNRWLVWAHGYRLGLIHTFQRERLPYDDLF